MIGDGIRPRQNYLYVCTGIAWDAVLCMGRIIVEHSSIFFDKSIVRTCYGLEFECREEVSSCSGAWLVIQLGGGAEQTVELLPHMVERN